MDKIESIAERIEKIRSTLPDSVRLMAVSKQVSPEAIRAAYGAGIRDFGENRVREATEKQEQLQDLTDITWHLIGHLQSNKAAKALEQFQWIHSVDSLKLAQRLDRLAGELSCRPFICLQVKILPDPDKFGWNVSELMTDLAELNKCRHLQIRGLMTILPQGLDDSQSLEGFNGLRRLAEKIDGLNLSNIKMEQLSMGMSLDYHLAISAGATIIRLGRVLFGERKILGENAVKQ
ncbi:MAG: YggS family pyridoxal phosphate-dependent enzyme [Cyanobacteriota bacterium]|nr:YggS family pyridoxal phosphate-dependent enzyme [Cyanobacteriota bacterium]